MDGLCAVFVTFLVIDAIAFSIAWVVVRNQMEEPKNGTVNFYNMK